TASGEPSHAPNDRNVINSSHHHARQRSLCKDPLGLDRDTNGEVVEVAATQAADVVIVTAREITRRLEQLLR
ncbi:hypothetical protein AB0I53_19155, partial [Saccharopolyspora sp. NPDC050389]|uniref:hypothetical protein n=1 Tax=Saccharopolyspora sp. NPDC050389 TaxID=3155516 RepID=UPI0033E1E6D6